ncbi:response regulator [bacterium]|nr:response regulator [bacterium]
MLVLIVDDRSEVRYYLREIIASSGHHSMEAEDGKQALEAYLRATPDVIISDLSLPDMGGLDLLETIRKQDSSVFFVLMTAKGSEEAARRALELQASNYLSKPLRFETIVSILDKYSSVLKSRELRAEVHQRVVSRELILRVENRLGLASEVADFLVTEAGNAISREVRGGIHLGLYELIVNAIEHGNLGISFDEKRRCLMESPYRLNELVQRRSIEPERVGRVVTIAFRMDQSHCEWVIEDQGDGFDWTAVPNPLEDNDEALNGRGIFLARYQFDEMHYLGVGNRVKVIKHRGADG